MQPDNNPGHIFVISSASGAGKTTIAYEFLKQYQDVLNISKIITYTSRQKRQGEIDGKDYYFVTTQDFEKLKDQGFFLETTQYADNYYGSPKSILSALALGKSFIIVTDRPGALRFKKLTPSAILIWIYVRNLEVLHDRLMLRNSENAEQLEKRLQLAKQELEAEKESPAFDYHIENDDINDAVTQLKTIVQKVII